MIGCEKPGVTKRDLRPFQNGTQFEISADECNALDRLYYEVQQHRMAIWPHGGNYSAVQFDLDRKVYCIIVWG